VDIMKAESIEELGLKILAEKHPKNTTL